MEAIQQFVPLILIFAIMYFLLIRPQQKKVKEHKAMVDGLRRGDQVVTAGGLIGKVVKVKDDGELEVERQSARCAIDHRHRRLQDRTSQVSAPSGVSRKGQYHASD